MRSSTFRSLSSQQLSPYCDIGQSFSSTAGVSAASNPLQFLVMPADYAGTARALALPVDDHQVENRALSPTWTRRSSHSPYPRPPRTLKQRLLDNYSRLEQRGFQAYSKLSPLQRTFLLLTAIALFVLTILFLVYNERFLRWLEPVAKRWKDLKGGWVILWLMTFFVSFPPLVGYTTCVTISGFVFGFPQG